MSYWSRGRGDSYIYEGKSPEQKLTSLGNNISNITLWNLYWKEKQYKIPCLCKQTTWTVTSGQHKKLLIAVNSVAVMSTEPLQAPVALCPYTKWPHCCVLCGSPSIFHPSWDCIVDFFLLKWCSGDSLLHFFLYPSGLRIVWAVLGNGVTWCEEHGLNFISSFKALSPWESSFWASVPPQIWGSLQNFPQRLVKMKWGNPIKHTWPAQGMVTECMLFWDEFW